MTDEEFKTVYPTLLAEAAKSQTVVYDASSYARSKDAVSALLEGSLPLQMLFGVYGKKLHWALVVALVEAHKNQMEPVHSYGNGTVTEYGRKLFGGPATATHARTCMPVCVHACIPTKYMHGLWAQALRWGCHGETAGASLPEGKEGHACIHHPGIHPCMRAYIRMHAYMSTIGGEATAMEVYRREGWTIWDNKEPRNCLRKEVHHGSREWTVRTADR